MNSIRQKLSIVSQAHYGDPVSTIFLCWWDILFRLCPQRFRVVAYFIWVQNIQWIPILSLTWIWWYPWDSFFFEVCSAFSSHSPVILLLLAFLVRMNLLLDPRTLYLKKFSVFGDILVFFWELEWSDVWIEVRISFLA